MQLHKPPVLPSPGTVNGMGSKGNGEVWGTQSSFQTMTAHVKTSQQFKYPCKFAKKSWKWGESNTCSMERATCNVRHATQCWTSRRWVSSSKHFAWHYSALTRQTYQLLLALGISRLQLLELPTRHMNIIHDKLGESFGKINTQIGIAK